MNMKFTMSAAIAVMSCVSAATEIVVCDQLKQTIDIYDDAGSNVWRWTAVDDPGIPGKFKAAFAGNVAEAKSVDGGEKILMVSCGGRWAVVDRATCRAEAWGTNQGWSHSIELVGKDVVAVVSTGGGNSLFLFDISGEAAISTTTASGCGSSTRPASTGARFRAARTAIRWRRSRRLGSLRRLALPTDMISVPCPAPRYWRLRPTRRFFSSTWRRRSGAKTSSSSGWA